MTPRKPKRMRAVTYWAVLDVTRDGESLMDMASPEGCPIFEGKDIAEAVRDASYQRVAEVTIREARHAK